MDNHFIGIGMKTLQVKINYYFINKQESKIHSTINVTVKYLYLWQTPDSLPSLPRLTEVILLLSRNVHLFGSVLPTVAHVALVVHIC